MKTNSDHEGVPTGTAADPSESQASTVSRLAQAVLALLILVVGGGVAAWTLTDEAPVRRTTTAPPERAAPLVRTVRVQPQARRVTVTAWGEVQPSRRITLRPRVAGHATEVAGNFTPGTVLEAGDLLVQLDRRPYELALERARTELVQAQSELALERGQQAVAKQALEVGDIPASERERALMLRVPQLEAAQAAVAAARVSVAEAKRALEHTAVRAPFDALVLEREVAVGAEVTSSSALATLVGVDQWWVELAVPMGSLQWIDFPGDGADGEGSTVRIHLQGQRGGGTVLTGQVARLRGNLTAEGRMARVLVRIDDPLGRAGAERASRRLLLGAFVRGEIVGTRVEEAFVFEPQWLHGENEAWLLAADGTLQIRELDIAYRDGERALVTGGLAPGDRVITSRLAMPAPGMALRAEDGGAVRQAGTATDVTADEG